LLTYTPYNNANDISQFPKSHIKSKQPDITESLLGTNKYFDLPRKPYVTYLETKLEKLKYSHTNSG